METSERLSLWNPHATSLKLSFRSSGERVLTGNRLWGSVTSEPSTSGISMVWPRFNSPLPPKYRSMLEAARLPSAMAVMTTFLPHGLTSPPAKTPSLEVAVVNWLMPTRPRLSKSMLAVR